MYEDKILVCVECGEEFIFSAGNQQFFAERGLMYEPKRCKACRDAQNALSSAVKNTSLPSVLIAATRCGYPGSPIPTPPCTALSAS